MAQSNVMVIGSFNMDLTVAVDELPAPGETVLGSPLVQSPGGKGSNQAIGAARLGASVAFLGVVGGDDFGNAAVQLHEIEGIDTTYLHRSRTPTGTALIVVDANGENQIAVAAGANRDMSLDMIEQAQPAIDAAEVLIGQHETPFECFLAAAQAVDRSTTTIILNPAPYQPIGDHAWSHIDIVTPNQHELQRLTQEQDPTVGAQRLLRKGPGAVVVTLGAQGALLVTPDGPQHFSAPEVEAIDTTGAGDAFNAGLAVGIAEGANLIDAVQLAIKAGAHAVTKRGVLDGLPTRREL